ncbi:MAG: hypothetical protein JW942_02320 [Opitutales bacterium]|nr:hypothetical protein [Opitutales bacterium]
MSEVQLFIETLLREPSWKFYLLAGLLCLLVILLLLRAARQPSQLIAFSTERGKVLIARRAISEIIAKASSRTFGVVKCKSRLKERRGKLTIRLRIQIRADSDLREVQKRLEAQIVDSLHRNLGFASLGEIITTVTSVVGEPDDNRDSGMSAIRRLSGEDSGSAASLPPREDTGPMMTSLPDDDEDDERV